MSNEILIPLDGSSLADSAIAHGAEIARRADASMHLVRVHTPIRLVGLPIEAPVAIPDPVLDETLREQEETWLANRASAASALNDVNVTYDLRIGIPEAEIVLAAAERRSRLIVCTTRGTGGPALRWLGSVADNIMRHASCPVLAMSPQAVKCSVVMQKVLVLLDGSEASASIIPHASWLAHAFAAELDYLRLVPQPSNPAQAILDYVGRTNPDAIALSTHGRGFARLILGGVADDLMRTSARPLLVFRPHDLAWDQPSRDRSLLAHVTH